MRRKDRELTSRSDIEEILEKADCCRLALNTGAAPYIVPLNYGYEYADSLVLYFHSANAGRKLDLIRKNNSAGFEIDCRHELETAENCCDWSMKYSSIIGSGIIDFVNDAEAKVKGLDLLMRHYGFKGETAYPPAMLSKTTVLRMQVAELSAKRKG